MKPTNEDRREVAENLRSMCSSGCRYAEEFYELLYETVMRTWDFHVFHDVADRLADLIEPEERTCRIYDTDHGFEDSIRCDACQMTFRRPWQPFKFCPNCGAKVVDEDA